VKSRNARSEIIPAEALRVLLQQRQAVRRRTAGSKE
jgi:hypothetical protein